MLVDWFWNYINRNDGENATKKIVLQKRGRKRSREFKPDNMPFFFFLFFNSYIKTAVVLRQPGNID